MTIQNVLDWLQEAENNDIWEVSTQSVKRHLEEVQKQQCEIKGVVDQTEQLPCDHDWIDIRSKHMEIQQCEKCGDYRTKPII